MFETHNEGIGLCNVLCETIWYVIINEIKQTTYYCVSHLQMLFFNLVNKLRDIMILRSW